MIIKRQLLKFLIGLFYQEKRHIKSRRKRKTTNNFLADYNLIFNRN